MTLELKTLNQPAVPLISQQLIEETERIDKYLERLGPNPRFITSQGQPRHVDSIHQLRVHTRRLRTLLRAIRGPLPQKTYALRQKYRKAVKATNELRDQHVLILRLKYWQDHASPEIGQACQWLCQQFATQRLTANAQPRSTQYWMKKFQRLNRRLRHRLQPLLAPHRNNAPTVAALLSKDLIQLRDEFSLHLEQWENGAIQALHQTRITTKHLRYLLTPWQRSLGPYRMLVKALKQLQNTLGHVHDNQVQREWLFPTIPALAQAFYASRVHTVETAPQQYLDPMTTAASSPCPGLISLAACLQAEHFHMQHALYRMPGPALRLNLLGAIDQLIESLDKLKIET